MTTQELIKHALDASKLAYAPYSKYHVGAALLTSSGRIYKGCNIENASYGLTVCAERTAVFKAVSEGEKSFVALAVVIPDGGYCCGACRQVLSEFNLKLRIICANTQGAYEREYTLDELLPQAFALNGQTS